MEVLGILLALGCAWVVLRPHFAVVSGNMLGESKEAEILSEHKSHCLQVLKDLELDYQTNKVSPEDYAQMKESISRELADILEQLDKRQSL